MRTNVDKKIEEIQEDLESDEFLTVRNPNNKRIVHIIKEDKVKNTTNIGDDMMYCSLCKHYRISGTAEIRLNKKFEKVASVKTKTQIKNSNDICGNCVNRL